MLMALRENEFQKKKATFSLLPSSTGSCSGVINFRLA
jgi:hypothetical protein